MQSPVQYTNHESLASPHAPRLPRANTGIASPIHVHFALPAHFRRRSVHSRWDAVKPSNRFEHPLGRDGSISSSAACRIWQRRRCGAARAGPRGGAASHREQIAPSPPRAAGWRDYAGADCGVPWRRARPRRSSGDPPACIAPASRLLGSSRSPPLSAALAPPFSCL